MAGLVKRKPHHPLIALQARFATAAALEITGAAIRSAAMLGYGLDAIVGVIARLTPADFVKSETAHSPRNPRVWHDSYRKMDGEHELYLKFAGETLIDLTLTSFKEA